MGTKTKVPRAWKAASRMLDRMKPIIKRVGRRYKQHCPLCKGKQAKDDDYYLVQEIEDYGYGSRITVREWQCPHGHRWEEVLRVTEIRYKPAG